MKAVWSLWTKPFREGQGPDWSDRFHWLLAWALSVKTAQRHYPHTALYTDTEGARVLVDELGLQFGTVSTALDNLVLDGGWWSAGKIYTYSLQTEPFIHIDGDVFLWQRLPAKVEQAPVFAQSPEHWEVGRSGYYRPEAFEVALGKRGGWLPQEWLWHRTTFGSKQRAVNCGILGANHIEFIRHYSSQALRILSDPANQPALLQLTGQPVHTILLEQYLLCACIDYHSRRPDSPFAGVSIRYLFQSMAHAYETADVAGYTHLIGGAKRRPEVCSQLEDRMRLEYPDIYAICRGLTGVTESDYETRTK